MNYAMMKSQLAEARHKRDDLIRRMRAKGAKIDTLAANFQLTKQRISQICDGANAKRKNGGAK